MSCDPWDGEGKKGGCERLWFGAFFNSFPFSSLSSFFFSVALEIILGLACTPGKPHTLTCTLGSAETAPHYVAQTSLELYSPALPSLDRSVPSHPTFVLIFKHLLHESK